MARRRSLPRGDIVFKSRRRGYSRECLSHHRSELDFRIDEDLSRAALRSMDQLTAQMSV